MLAEQVHDAGYSARIKVRGIHGLGRKDALLVGAGDVQARLNVTVSFRERESGGLAPERDALLDLAQRRSLETVFQLGLAGEDDLKSFSLRVSRFSSMRISSST